MKEQFEENGFIIIDHAIAASDLLHFRHTFHQIVQRILHQAAVKNPALANLVPDSNADNALIALRHTDPNYVSMVQRLISRSPEFLRLCSSPTIMNTLRQLFDVNAASPLYLLSNGIIFTTPNDADHKHASNIELVWHKDTFYTLPQSRFIQLWAPVLQQASADMGSLHVCPGSHKEGIGKQCFHPEAPFNHRYTMQAGSEKAYTPQVIELTLGQVLLFDGQLMHASGHNHSDGKVRASMIGICHDASKHACIPVSPSYHYHEKTPEQWFYQCYQDENMAANMHQQLANASDPAGGV